MLRQGRTQDRAHRRAHAFFFERLQVAGKFLFIGFDKKRRFRRTKKKQDLDFFFDKRQRRREGFARQYGDLRGDGRDASAVPIGRSKELRRLCANRIRTAAALSYDERTVLRYGYGATCLGSATYDVVIIP
jgi:hypothetical protein